MRSEKWLLIRGTPHEKRRDPARAADSRIAPDPIVRHLVAVITAGNAVPPGDMPVHLERSNSSAADADCSQNGNQSARDALCGSFSRTIIMAVNPPGGIEVKR